MSTNPLTNSNTTIPTNEPFSTNNPFNTVFDGEDETDDEWWEDDDLPAQDEEQPQTPVRTTLWPKPATYTAANVQSTNRVSLRKPDKRYSVQKPIRDKSTKRQKRQNAKAGIKLVTNLTRHQARVPVLLPNPKPIPQTGCFVDLAALKALNGETSQSNVGGFWKSRKGKEVIKEQPTNHDLRPSTTSHEPSSASDSSHLMPSPGRMDDDLSPGDRPIVIGLSIPTADVADHTFSPQTAASETTKIVRSYEHRTPTAFTPETPTIIITPAQGVSTWSMLDQPNIRPRAASSIYSQAPCIADRSYNDESAPPIPQMPAAHLEEERLRLAGLKSYFSPDSDDATMWENDSNATKSRVMSSCTVFEEDESPILTRTGRARSMSGASKSIRHPSINTIGNQRQSGGWWNVITTPFLTRSNTFATKEIENQPVPALPSLTIAAAKATEVERDEKNWQKEFSPLTPPTAATMDSDRWWEAGKTEQTPVLRETRHKVEASTGTLPLIIPEFAGISSAESPSPLSAGESQIKRTNTTSTFHTMTPGGFSPNDREIPMVFNTPPLKPPNTSSTTAPSQTINLNFHSASTQVIQPMRAAIVEGNTPMVPLPGPSPTPEAPPPPYSPAPARIKKYRPVFPPGHALGIQYPDSQYPASPGPVSPGLQAAMTSQGGIPMSDVPLTPATARRPINLNSGYPNLPGRQDYTPFTAGYLHPSSKKAKKAEAKRQRYEKEEAAARRAGGLWRGRGCFSNNGCYGRGGAEGRKRRRWYIGLITAFLTIIILAVVLATQLVRKSNTIEEPSQWLNLTGFPPIFTGFSTIVAPTNIEADTGCVFPSTQWSCHLPKELQPSIIPYRSDQPHFLLRIQWDNSTEANRTFANVTHTSNRTRRSLGGNAVSAGQFVKYLLLKARQAVTIVPTPEPPVFTEQFFLGNTTDKIVSAGKAGEPTPFYISFLSTEEAKQANKVALQARQNKGNPSAFPDVKAGIPGPTLSADGTAAPANLLPFPSQQPLRLYDRDLKTEHYSFYTYYDRSIFLKSVSSLNETNLGTGEVPDDRNGGARASEAAFRCTWRETRFLVQIWTKMNDTSRLLNSTRISTQKIDTGGAVNSTLAAQDFTQPGSFPYPVTITIDRHGGDPKDKMLYCYSMDNRRQLIVSSAQLHDENRGFGGTLINGAPTFFRNSSNPTLGGFDGGTGGCTCKWRNFDEVVRSRF